MHRACWWWCVCAALSAAVAARPPPVLLLKCCRVGDTLQPGGADEQGWECRAGGPARWPPLVYSLARRSYLPGGDLPRHYNVSDAAQPPCPRLRLLHTRDFRLISNGSLYDSRRSRTYSPLEYCADTEAALVCADLPSSPDAPGPDLHKCCREGAGYDPDTRVCAPHERAEARALLALLRPDNTSAVGLLLGFPHCVEEDGGRLAEVGGLERARLLRNGSLRLEGGALLPAEGYCAEMWAGEERARVLACREHAGREAPGPRTRHILYGVGLAVGAVFLAGTLLASWLMPAAHRALHWHCQTRYVAALLVADSLLAAANIAPPHAFAPPACRAIAVCMHFLFLSAFFWLNTMCFNIWWTFRDFRPRSLEKSQEVVVLRWYGVYAWGGPLLIAGVGALLDLLHAASPDPLASPVRHLLRPRFAEQRCWFYGDAEILAYFFAPVGVLLCVNVALFGATAHQLACGLWRRDEVKSTSERAALGRVCGKLVVVMGVTWVADVVSWACGGPEYLWYASDLLNALQGVLIFCVVGCQAGVRGACCARLRAALRLAPSAPSSRPARRRLHSSCADTNTHTTAAPAPPGKPPMETCC